ncbi:hypothetical protein VSR01_22515 [Actinacidiphila sp. DG2A-62]|uniref:hypothetical protein n=1 Tax=Actinacidiphila sp. DG2A-62 TaxID=3108821 RepID=UPI002DB9A822|nr:hypothetical protein [Actinacidiphila sp. DG2A-62]MEC3996136.1 hypothetical protein [Actinacidiphila sp. DG2A-62]
MTRLFTLYVPRGATELHEEFAALRPTLRWSPPNPTVQPLPGIAVGDITVLASTSANSRVRAGGWDQARFALVRIMRMATLASPEHAEWAVELTHTHAFRDVPGTRLGPVLAEALRRSAVRGGRLHHVDLGIDLALLTPPHPAPVRTPAPGPPPSTAPAGRHPR